MQAGHEDRRRHAEGTVQAAAHPGHPRTGQHNSSADGGCGVRGVHLKGFGEQRAGRVSCHDTGVGTAAAQATDETQ